MKYKKLKEFLIKCSNSYYKDSISLISDYEFDTKLNELEKMEKEQKFRDDDSPTQKPGSDLINVSLSSKHERKMLSLDNTYTFEEIKKWFLKMKEEIGEKLSIAIEYKYDGGSAAIRFKNGKVIKALTRGTGDEGEDITENVKLLDWSKISKDFSGEVRGELIITKSGFKILNKKGNYQNPRNLLSGSMKLLDSSEFKQRAPYIKFFAYWNELPSSGNYIKDIKYLQGQGFETSYNTLKEASNINEIKTIINKIEKEKDDLEIEIDGVVMKIIQTKFWDQIGSTAKFPKWAKAYKYKQEEIETIVEKITYEVGRTGKITGLCWFSPVFIDDSTIEKATLNNKKWQENLDIGIGDKIIVRKAAAIIPQIIAVSNREGRKEKAEFPKVCPVCKTKLKKLNEEHSDFFCMNQNCSARICDTIMNFTRIMRIDGFAEIVIEKIHSLGCLNSISDIYKLKNHKEELELLERFGKKMVSNLLKNIENSKNQPLEHLIAGLGIRNVGLKTAKAITKKFDSIKALKKATIIELTSIEDIGEIVAQSIIDYFNDEKNQKIIEELESAGVKVKQEIKTRIKENNLVNGKSFCITGKLSISRKEYEKQIEFLGGKIVSNVTSKTNFLVTNDTKSGSSKNLKAEELKIPVINEEKLIKMLISKKN